MKAGKIGWILILFSSVAIVLLNRALFSGVAPDVRLLLMVFLAIIVFSLMLVGQILVIWQNRSFFKHSTGVLLGIGLLILNLAIYSSESLAVYNLKIIQILYSLNLIWLVAYIITIGCILALHLYHNDRSLLFIGITLLTYVWANLIYLTRVGPEIFITRVLGADGPVLLTALTCVTLWVLPIGLISFLIHSVKMVGSEINPEYLDVQRKRG